MKYADVEPCLMTAQKTADKFGCKVEYRMPIEDRANKLAIIKAKPGGKPSFQFERIEIGGKTLIVSAPRMNN